MSTIGIPPRSAGTWDVPAAQVADEMRALKAKAAAEEREQQQAVDRVAEAARRKRQARAERIERKRVEHLRGHLPLDDPDRHDIDPLDRAFASAVSTCPTPATDADYPEWSARLADQIAKQQRRTT